MNPKNDRAGQFRVVVCSFFVSLFGILLFLSLVSGKTKDMTKDRYTATMGQTGREQTTLPVLEASSAVLMDADTNRVLFEKNADEERAMASTTKIMTLVIALEYGNLEDAVAVSAYAASMPEVRLSIRKGEMYYLKDLLYSLMLESHNDVAVAIAEHIGGSVEAFAGYMNEKAKAIGAYHTQFVTPNGLDAQGHYSTAKDMALIASYALKNPQVIEIINTQSYTFSDVSKNRNFSVQNHNAFLQMYEGAIGVKTGFTGNAGYCFVGAVKQKGHTLIAVVLGCGWPPHKTYKWKDMRTLFDYGFTEFEEKQIYVPKREAALVSVVHGVEADQCYGYTVDSVSALLSQNEQVTYQMELPRQLEAPVKKDTVIGTIEIQINQKPFQRLPIYASRDIRRLTYYYALTYVWRFFCIQT